MPHYGHVAVRCGHIVPNPQIGRVRTDNIDVVKRDVVGSPATVAVVVTLNRVVPEVRVVGIRSDGNVPVGEKLVGRVERVAILAPEVVYDGDAQRVRGENRYHSPADADEVGIEPKRLLERVGIRRWRPDNDKPAAADVRPSESAHRGRGRLIIDEHRRNRVGVAVNSRGRGRHCRLRATSTRARRRVVANSGIRDHGENEASVERALEVAPLVFYWLDDGNDISGLSQRICFGAHC